MIKANELRIGNYVQRIEHKDLRRVVELTGNGTISHLHIGIDDKEVGLWDDDAVEPIPLTEEWLLKFGAEVYEFDSGRPNQYRIKNRLFVIRNGEIVDYGCSVAIQYVHKLQNLYFALTGEELTVKE